MVDIPIPQSGSSILNEDKVVLHYNIGTKYLLSLILNTAKKGCLIMRWPFLLLEKSRFIHDNFIILFYQFFIILFNGEGFLCSYVKFYIKMKYFMTMGRLFIKNGTFETVT